MDLIERINLIKSIAEEIITEEELKELLETNDKPKAYDGFEPSGLAHIPFGLLRALNLEKLLKANIDFTLYLADYFAFINNKLEGNMQKIKACGEYFIEVWKAAGIPIKKINVVWASELMDSLDYWGIVLSVAKELSLRRTLRATTIMGRTMQENLSTAQLMYPAMQVADIFALDIDICQLGLDQRRANVLAREIAPKLKRKKPVAVHHHMLLGLQGIKENIIESKMSKSMPESSIFVHDTEKEIKEKIAKAFCEPKNIENNPLLDYAKHLIFPKYNEMQIEREKKFGGNISFNSYIELENAFRNAELHPLDLKNSVAFYLNEMIKPIREHFEKNPKAAKLYAQIKETKTTR